jgi:LPS-assembly protein
MRSALLFFFVLLSVGSTALEAEEQKEKLAELYADRFVSEGDRVDALGHVVLSYDGTLFLGDRASYDRKANVITLEGNVEILSDRGSKVLAERVVFEVDDNRVTFRDFYQTDRNDIWIYADEAQKRDGNFSLRNSVLSSCSVERPDWSVKFDEAVYDSETKYMRLRDVKVYARELPIFYTPYLGFSLERQRHSGLLMPHFGISKDEGYYYEQPYFWAISESMDLEIDPSVRSKRGVGIYGTFRFVDSPWSHGTIRTGFFGDNDAFTRTHDLANSSHYGLEVLYESSNVLRSWRPEGYRDGLYVNLNLFNDIDYENLQFRTLDHLEETSRFKESRINYFLYNDRQYFGIRGRYFIDTTSEENNETIQELPALQYHRFASPLWGGLFDYSVDARIYNFWRQDGTRALRGEASLPLEFHVALLEDYLHLSVKEELAASDTKFFENSLQIDQNHYSATVLHHNIELSSDLIRGYESGVHTMILSALFTKTTLLAEGDLRYEEINEELINDYDLDMVYDTRLAFKMRHFWESYDSDFSMDYLAVVDYYPEDDSKWNLLSQEFHLRYGHYRFSSRIDYSIYRHSLSQFTNTFSYSDETLGFRLEHTRRESSLYESGDGWGDSLDQNELSVEARYRASDIFTWYGGYTYDFKEEAAKDWHIGTLIDRKCWNFKVVFEQEITPVLTKNGEGSIRENKVYFQFNLVPFGGVGSAQKASI